MNYSVIENMKSYPLITGKNWDRDIIGQVMGSVNAGETHYVDVPGKSELRLLLSDFLKNEGMTDGSDVLITAGVQEARFLALNLLNDTKGKVFIPEVVSPGARLALGVKKIDPGVMECENDGRFLVSVEGIRNAVLSGAKVLYLESPSRLTGACYDETEINRISGVCKENDVTVILDIGLYPWLDSPCVSLGNHPDMTGKCLVFGEVWPGSGVDEAFIAFIAANREMISRLTVQKQVLSICTSAPSQNAAIAAEKIYQKKHKHILEDIQEVKDRFITVLKRSGAYNLPCFFANFILCKGDRTLMEKLESANIQFTDCKYFGHEGLIQIPVSEPALNRMNPDTH